jgi:hypothetical protein
LLTQLAVNRQLSQYGLSMDGALVGARSNTFFLSILWKLIKYSKIIQIYTRKKILKFPNFFVKKRKKIERKKFTSHIHLWNLILTREKKRATWSQNFQPLMLVCPKTCFLPGNCRLHRWNATFAYVPFQNCRIIWWPAKS